MRAAQQSLWHLFHAVAIKSPVHPIKEPSRGHLGEEGAGEEAGENDAAREAEAGREGDGGQLRSRRLHSEKMKK